MAKSILSSPFEHFVTDGENLFHMSFNWHWELLAILQIMRFRKKYIVQQLMHNIVQFDYGTHSSLTRIKLNNHLVLR